MKRLKVVYVAGPFRGPDHYAIHTNIIAAEALALKVWKAGMVAICPHLNTAHFQGAAVDEIWLDGDIELVRRCDAMILVKDWSRSNGTQAEVEFAIANDIPVFESIEGLVTWHAQLSEQVPTVRD